MIIERFPPEMLSAVLHEVDDTRTMRYLPIINLLGGSPVGTVNGHYRGEEILGILERHQDVVSCVTSLLSLETDRNTRLGESFGINELQANLPVILPKFCPDFAV